MNGTSRNPILLTVALILHTAGISITSIAQEPDISLEEIVVTAQRREQSAQDVAISMTVLNQEQMANANMVNSMDLAAYTPSMSVNTRFGPENASFAIRGFTQDLRTTASVGVYFAEVVAPRGQISQTSGDGAGPGMMFDLENVQVLKGPQGTLFGRNTTGGAVLFTPARPSDVLEGHVEASFGNYGMNQQQAVLNLPLHDRIKLRLGVDRKERDGHLRNYTGIGASRLGDVNYTAGRLSLVVDVTDRLENYSILTYVDSDTKGSTATLFDCNPDAMLGFIVAPRCEQQLEDERTFGADGFYQVASTVPDPRTEIQELRFINTTTWEMTDDITLKGIMAYAHLETENESDVFGSWLRDPDDPRREFAPGNTLVNPDFPVTSQETWVGELQAQGFSFGGRLEWQGGLYLEESRPDGDSGNIAATLIDCENASIRPDLADSNCVGRLPGVGGILSQSLKTTYSNRAIYAQATYDFLEQLSITGGVRYTRDKTRGERVFINQDFDNQGDPQAPEIEAASPQQKSSAPTGLLELQYRPLNDVMLYAKYVRGYRQGSVNLSADSGIDVFDEETVNTYEIGTKVEFTAPIPGRFNVAAFYNDFKDMQLQGGYLSGTVGPTTAIFNAGRARIAGVEADTTLHLLPGLTAAFSISYLDTELRRQDMEGAVEQIRTHAGNFAANSFSPTADVGDELPFAPKVSSTSSLNYTLPLPSRIGLVQLGGTYIYTGKQLATARSNSPNATISSFSLLNLHLNWMDLFGQPFDLSLFATNVTDKEYVTYYSGTYEALGFDSRNVGMPRMYGARLRYNF